MEKCEKMDCKLRLLGRVLFTAPFLMSGISHLMMGSEMAGAVPSWVPGGVFWVYFTGVAMLAASVSIIINKCSKLASSLLALLLLIFVLTIHVPGLSDEASAQMATVMLVKDIGLMGGALLIAGTSCMGCKKKK